MNPLYIIIIICLYFLLILTISFFTGRKATNDTFFKGNRQSKWYLVSIGMLGASISGVTFISVPGWVYTNHFAYIQMVLGFVVGYLIIANVLLPLYYKLNLTSIYTYLDQRFGNISYKTGAWCFLISRTVGASFRLYLVANVLQVLIFDNYHIPYIATVAITILLIWLYTFKGGIRTIVFTDVLQTFFLLSSLGLTVYFISRQLHLNFSGLITELWNSEYSQVFYFHDFKNNENHFIKQFISGVFIAIVMTGLDQDMMQKNLTCRNIKEAKKNVYWYGTAFLPVNLVFLSLGALLFIYARQFGFVIPENTDQIYPMLATCGCLPTIIMVLFILGLIAAAYSSADSALTALTTSVTIDILQGNRLNDNALKKLRVKVHIIMSIVLLLFILLFRVYNNDNVISAIYSAAAYTYGPLLGIFSFGLFTKWRIKERFVPFITIVSPVLCFILNKYSIQLFNGYRFSFEILLLNGLLTFLGLLFIKRK